MEILAGETYDDQSKEYAAFAEGSFSWRYIEQPGMNRYLHDHFTNGPHTRVLDLGCGNGRVIRHLMDKGIPAANITGLDPSSRMLDEAASTLPQEIGLVMDRAAEMPFADDSFNLVVANMVLHAMDDNELNGAMDRISDVLVPGGEFFFIDSNPLVGSKKAGATKGWTTRQSPWGRMLRVFNHDHQELVEHVAPSHGLERVHTGLLEIDPDGMYEDPDEFARYSRGDFRFAALLRKTDS